LPFDYNCLNPLDVAVISDRPIAAGGFANILEATHRGRKVILKSYRHHEASDVPQVIAVRCNGSLRQVYTAEMSQRLRNEVHVWSLLQRGGVNVVRFVGLYSTESHPFGLIYEHDGLDLKQYLRDGPNVERVKLVIVPWYMPLGLSINFLYACPQQLKDIAEGLNDLHDRGIVHGCFKRVSY
jgi:serine/threonine protein kinase